MDTAEGGSKNPGFQPIFEGLRFLRLRQFATVERRDFFSRLA